MRRALKEYIPFPDVPMPPARLTPRELLPHERLLEGAQDADTPRGGAEGDAPSPGAKLGSKVGAAAQLCAK